MALSTGTTGANAASATAVYDVLSPLLTAASWAEQSDSPVSAATAGTTAACRVWKASDLNLYVVIEVDDTNDRLRFRACEEYDTAATGSPALKMKFPAPGNQSNTSVTPTLAQAAISDAFLAIFQTQGTTASVGWVNIPTAEGGTPYIMGVRSDELTLATNVTNNNWVHLGRLGSRYLGNAGYANTVYLGGRMISTNNDVSWTFGASTGTGQYRVSREPFGNNIATIGAFCFGVHPGPIPADSSGYLSDATGTLSAHRWFTGDLLFPEFISGITTVSAIATRTNLAQLTGWALTWGDATPTGELAHGDTFTISGDTWVVLGPLGANSSVMAALNAMVVVKSNRF